MDLVPSDYKASGTLDVNVMSSLEESVLTKLENVRNQVKQTIVTLYKQIFSMLL